LAVKLSGSQVVQAAAGHSRASNSGGSSGGGGSGGSGGSSASNNAAGGGAMINGCSSGAMIGCGGGGGGGAVGGGAGAGGMPPGGNGGRGNYGPSSPPTGSLPPFYESLKGGNNLANFANQYNSAQGNWTYGSSRCPHLRSSAWDSYRLVPSLFQETPISHR